MKYALLIYTKPGSHEALPDAEREAVLREYFAISDDPRCLAGAQLHPVQTATSVRVENGSTLTTDGPFADTKEVFGGLYILEADDVDEAVAVAERIPAARLGGVVEVRPVVEQ